MRVAILVAVAVAGCGGAEVAPLCRSLCESGCLGRALQDLSASPSYRETVEALGLRSEPDVMGADEIGVSFEEHLEPGACRVAIRHWGRERLTEVLVRQEGATTETLARCGRVCTIEDRPVPPPRASTPESGARVGCTRLCQAACFDERLARAPARPTPPQVVDALGLVGPPGGGVESGEAIETYVAAPGCEVVLTYGPTVGGPIRVEATEDGRTLRARCDERCARVDSTP